MKDMLKTTVYLQSMDDYQAMNKAYIELFAQHKPARATAAVSRLARGALIEIEAIACDPEATGEIIRM